MQTERSWFARHEVELWDLRLQALIPGEVEMGYLPGTSIPEFEGKSWREMWATDDPRSEEEIRASHERSKTFKPTWHPLMAIDAYLAQFRDPEP